MDKSSVLPLGLLKKHEFPFKNTAREPKIKYMHILVAFGHIFNKFCPIFNIFGQNCEIIDNDQASQKA